MRTRLATGVPLSDETRKAFRSLSASARAWARAHLPRRAGRVLEVPCSPSAAGSSVYSRKMYPPALDALAPVAAVALAVLLGLLARAAEARQSLKKSIWGAVHVNGAKSLRVR